MGSLYGKSLWIGYRKLIWKVFMDRVHGQLVRTAYMEKLYEQFICTVNMNSLYAPLDGYFLWIVYIGSLY